MSTQPIKRQMTRNHTRIADSIIRKMPKLNPPAEFAQPTRHERVHRLLDDQPYGDGRREGGRPIFCVGGSLG